MVLASPLPEPIPGRATKVSSSNTGGVVTRDGKESLPYGALKIPSPGTRIETEELWGKGEDRICFSRFGVCSVISVLSFQLFRK